MCGLYRRQRRLGRQSFSLIQERIISALRKTCSTASTSTPNARLPRGIVVQGGVSSGRERTNNCYALNDLSLGVVQHRDELHRRHATVERVLRRAAAVPAERESAGRVSAAVVGLADERDVSGPARSADPGDRDDPQLRASRRRSVAACRVPGHRGLHGDGRGQPDPARHGVTAIA